MGNKDLSIIKDRLLNNCKLRANVIRNNIGFYGKKLQCPESINDKILLEQLIDSYKYSLFVTDVFIQLLDSLGKDNNE